MPTQGQRTALALGMYVRVKATGHVAIVAHILKPIPVQLKKTTVRIHTSIHVSPHVRPHIHELIIQVALI